MAAASLLFGGVFDACPDLKACLAHAGGSSPYIWGRLYLDTIAHLPSVLRFLIDEVGADRVLLGTDHPADMGDIQMAARVEALGLPEWSTRQILGDTAASLLAL